MGRYCCKSRKLPGDKFPAKRPSGLQPSMFVFSIALARSPVGFPSGDEVPHIFTRKSRLRPREFLISSAKRLLQQYRPVTVLAGASRSGSAVWGAPDAAKMHRHRVRARALQRAPDLMLANPLCCAEPP